MSRFTIIVAATKANGIGVNGGLPWKLSKELKYFARATTNAPEGQQNAVIMGRNTWESIPDKFRPLPRRKNIVISRNENYELGAASEAGTQSPHRGFIIGGATLYTEAFKFPLSRTEPCVDRVLLTRILSPEFNECDTFLADFLQDRNSEGKEVWTRAAHKELEEWVGFEVAGGELEENGVTYEFQMWVRGA